MKNKFKKLGLSEEWLQAIEILGFHEPTAIQEAAVPQILAGKNIAGHSATGTGKTLAYLLPVLQQLDENKMQVQAVIAAPSHELVMQIGRQAQELISHSGKKLSALSLIGSANLNRQVEKLKKKPQLIVGSVGRIIELQAMRKLKLQDVKILVLDEFDYLLSKQCLAETAKLVKLMPRDKQILLFSATAPQKALRQADFLAQPEIISVRQQGKLPSAITNGYIRADFRDKIDVLRKFCLQQGIKRGLVFFNRAFDVETSLSKLLYHHVKAVSLAGKAGKKARRKALADFSAGRIELLLATDIAARGLDIKGVEAVFNLDLPEDGAVYLHRAGRTGRAGEAGLAVTLVAPQEKEKFHALLQSLQIEAKLLADKTPHRRSSAAGEKRRKHPKVRGKQRGFFRKKD